MKSVHQVPYHKRVCCFSVFVLKGSSCVQSPVNTLSSPLIPEIFLLGTSFCFEINCVSGDYVESQFTHASVSQTVFREGGGLERRLDGVPKLVTTLGSKVSCTYRESIPKPRTSSPHLSHYEHTYEACPESKDTKVLNMYSIFNLQKRHCK
jgi:hypothetical protein